MNDSSTAPQTSLFALLLAAAITLTSTACQNGDTARQMASDAMQEETDKQTMFALSSEEKAEGFRVLFDGSSLDHWRGFKTDDVPKGWSVENRSLHFAGDGGGDIVTRDEFESFELRLDWRISEGGNSGIFFHVAEGDQENTYETGPEMQVLDNERHADARNGLDRTAGANYALHEPTEDASRPAGEWNEVRLVVDGAHVEHWLNGKKIVEYEMWSDDWKRRVAAGKFDAMPGYGLEKTGHIGLQDHGDPVWFRNIRIKTL